MFNNIDDSESSEENHTFPMTGYFTPISKHNANISKQENNEKEFTYQEYSKQEEEEEEEKEFEPSDFLPQVKQNEFQNSLYHEKVGEKKKCLSSIIPFFFLKEK